MEKIVYARYIVIDVLKCDRKRTFLEKIRFKYRKEVYYKILLEKLLYTADEILLMGKSGLFIELPFTSQELEKLPKAYIEQYIQNILHVYDFTECYLCESLKAFRQTFGGEKKWLLSYLLFEKGVITFLDYCKIPKKNARFVVIDSGDKKVELILESLLCFANYLTIVTNRMEHFLHAVDVVYQENGLMIDLVSSYQEVHRKENVVINLDRENYRLYSKFEENTCVIDLEFTDTKHEYIENRRKKLTILYDYEILVGGIELDKELAAQIIGSDNWKVGRFLHGLAVDLSAEELKDVAAGYEIEFKKLNILQQ